jgi:hypothetical protein
MKTRGEGAGVRELGEIVGEREREGLVADPTSM